MRFGRTGRSRFLSEYIRRAYSCSLGWPLPSTAEEPVPSSRGNCSVAGRIQASTVRQPVRVIESELDELTWAYWPCPLNWLARGPFGSRTTSGRLVRGRYAPLWPPPDRSG